MPSTLDETYERVLTGIDQSDVQEAQSMLQWLALAQRPLTIQEVAETAVVKVEGAPVDSEDRFYDPYDAIRICRSLVATTEETLRICGKLVRCQVVRFAHFSVKEYLLSERISQGPAASFAIDPAVSQSQIGQCCLSVLLQNDKRIDQLPDSGNMPLLYYAAEYWFTYFRHYKAITSHADPFTSLVIKFFAESPMAFQNWLSAYDVNIRWGSVRFSGWRVRFGPSPLYYACLLGLEELVKILLNQGVDANAFGGKYGNALVAASMQGSELTVRYLLQHKADVHGPGGWVFGNALQASSYFGHEHIVKILLENGAMPDARRDEDDSALQHACESGHESIVRLLLDAGSDVNTRAGGYGYALTAAAERGHKSIVALLLDHGANANNQGGIYGNALQAAAGGHAATTEAYESIILSLLNAGANINAQGGGFGDALRAACTRQHASIMKLLLRRGAKIDPIVQKLLDAEEATVNTNAPANSDIAYALQAAYSDRDEEQIISLLVSATLRLIHIRHESLRAHRSRQPKPNLVRLRKVVRYALKSETDRYWSEHLEKS